MSKLVKLSTYRIAIIVCALCGGLIGYKVGTHNSQSDLDAEYERGCSDMIEAYYRNQPYYKAILDSRMYEDTILMGWVVRQFQDSHLTDPELVIEDDTLAYHAWDSLGYCVLCGQKRPDSNDTMLALEPDSMIICTVSVEALKNLYRASGMFIEDSEE